MNQREPRRPFPAAWTWLVAGLLLAGCGRSDGPELHRLSGAVTFAGKPVPAGTILLEPDASRSNRGPAGYATIRDGRFDTRDGGKGTVGGPHRVRIAGEENLDAPVAPGSEAPTTRPLFPEYVTTVDLPREDATHDFSVPGG